MAAIRRKCDNRKGLTLSGLLGSEFTGVVLRVVGYEIHVGGGKLALVSGF